MKYFPFSLLIPNVVSASPFFVNTFQDIPRLVKFRRVLFVVCQVLPILQVALTVLVGTCPKAMLAALAYFQSLLGVGQT